MRIDLLGLAERIQALPLADGVYKDLRQGPAGQVYYLKGTQETGADKLAHFYLDSLGEETIAENVASYRLAAGHGTVLLQSGESWAVIPSAGKAEADQGALALDGIQIRVDPRPEWAEMYLDAWRINRDYFYDPGMYGLDWDAMRVKYASFLPDLATREDLNRLLEWLFSELQVSHHIVTGGDLPDTGATLKMGLLGADYAVENGRYRIVRIYRAPNWIPSLRSPLTEPGVDVREGDYLLAVNGRPLDPATNVFRAFENTAGAVTQLTVGPDPGGAGARTVTVEPIEDETELRMRDLVERNLDYVTEAGGGRVGYVYLPDTGTEGHEFMKRYFFPQAARQALIIDERFNRGGQYADYVLGPPHPASGSGFRPALGRRAAHPGRRHLRSQGHDRQRELRLRRRPASLGLPPVRRGHAGGRAHLGRPGRPPGLPPTDGRRPRHRPQPGRFRRDRLDRGERRRDARPHGGATPRRRGRRPRPSTGDGHRTGPGRTGRRAAHHRHLAAVSRQGTLSFSHRVCFGSNTGRPRAFNSVGDDTQGTAPGSRGVGDAWFALTRARSA